MYDWQSIVLELEAAGLSQGEIAERVPCSPSLVSALKNGQRGTNLNYKHGTGLAQLHASVCRKKRPAANGSARAA
jgi:hypothetical protein